MKRTAPLGIDSTVTLSDGCKMPQLGLGTYSLDTPASSEKAILAAFKCGYRLFDTAELYKNEKLVADAVKKSGVPRDQYWVTTKIWESHHGYEACRKHVQETVKSMDIGYIDLYLIHAPCREGKNVETYKALLEMKDEGLIRSVGVSNFGIHHLKGLKESGLPKPSVNQIELHPWKQNRDIVKYCREEGIAVEGYSPLAKSTRNQDETLVSIAKKHNKTPCQILVRWGLQNGHIIIPMADEPDYILENSQVFDFELTDEDMQTFYSVKEHGCNVDPTTRPWTG